MARIRWQERVVIAPDLHLGPPCIKGTRIPVVIIVGSPADGMTPAEVLQKYPPAASAIASKPRAIHGLPDQVKVAFGLKMDAGAILASAGVEAHFKVTPPWRREGAGALPATAR